MSDLKIIKYEAEYASQVIQTIPTGYIDKTLCGVGLSSVALENNENIILAVPNVSLIHNKVAQYPNHRFNGKVFGVEAGVTKKDIEDYIKNTEIIKIMVSYDSLYKVEYLLNKCRLIIDESNRLLSYKKLKSSSKKSSGKDILSYLFDLTEKYKDTVSFISATPIPLNYMPRWISTIPHIKMEWTNTIKAQPILMERTYPYASLTQEILKPIVDHGFIKINGEKIKKAIIFINSVSTIVKCLKDANISSEDVRVVVGDNLKNDVALKGFKRLDTPSNLTKFTFVTGTGFDGIDLVDDEAISVVVSNTDKQYHLVDITTDLKQAISRQRNKNNPNYGKYIFLYNQTVFNKTEKDLLDILSEKYSQLTAALYLWEVAKRDNMKGGFKWTKENPDFIAYTIWEEATETYTIDEDLFQADRYFILETRKSFEKGFDIKGIIPGDNYITISPIELPKNITYIDLVKYFNINYDINTNTIDWKLYSTRVEWIEIIETSYKLYSKTWTNIDYAKNMIKNYVDPLGKLKTIIQGSFAIGKRYPRKVVKEILLDIYKDQGMSRLSKYSDLFEFFEIKEVMIRGERIMEILKRK